MDSILDRRAAIMGMAALTAGCTTLQRYRGRDLVQVNLADRAAVTLPPPPVPVPPDDGVSLQTSFDAVRRMTVPTFIDKAGPYTFVVDTGANHSVMASELAAALTLPSGGRAAIHGIAGVDPAETVMVNRLTVGGLSSRRIRMPLLSRNFLGAEGLLGVNVLEGRRAKLDFRHNTFSIASSKDLPTANLRGRATRLPRPDLDPSVVVVPARQRFGQLTIVDAEVEGVPVTAFLDSGAETTVGNLALRDAVLTREPGLRAQILTVQLVSATGQTVGGELSSIPPLRLGGLRIGNLSCVFADLHTFRIWDLIDRPAILIGVDVMRHFESIELDFGRSLVTFTTPRAPAPGVGVTPPVSAPTP
ncbi:MAG TPA: retroviral-like aspartic protease family protein [Caulobacteraceae bacterium]